MTNLFEGEEVHYNPPFPTQIPNQFGRVKSFPNNNLNSEDVFVVFNCAGNWTEYRNYTALIVPKSHLKLSTQNRTSSSVNL